MQERGNEQESAKVPADDQSQNQGNQPENVVTETEQKTDNVTTHRTQYESPTPDDVVIDTDGA